jgi:signal peptidase I
MSGHDGNGAAAGEQGGAAAGTGQTPPGPVRPARPGRRSRGRLLRDFFMLIGLAVLFTVPAKAFVAQAFLVPTGSMADTLRPGDRVLVNKLIPHLGGVRRGDIVVFSGTGSWGPAPPPAASPPARWYRDALTATGLASNGTDYIKRVIGLPGDRVACCDARGLITVNGVPLHEGDYLYPGERPSGQPFHVTVPPGRLWVMGDHRADSDDPARPPERPGVRDDTGECGGRPCLPHRVAARPARLAAHSRRLVPAVAARRGRGAGRARPRRSAAWPALGSIR